MTCIIIEDQAPAQRVLKKYIKDLETLELKETFSDITKALKYLGTEEIDLIFLDIHLPKMNGIEFLKIKPSAAKVILTTAYSDYALQSYEYHVVDYLLKPFSFQRFVQAVTKAQSLVQPTFPPMMNRSDVTEIFIKSGYEHIKLTIDKIRYIQADADYTEIHTGNQKNLSSEPLKFWLNFLNPNQFVQVHKSYIVNISEIKKISGNRIFLISGEEIPIGRVYKEPFSEKFLKK